MSRSGPRVRRRVRCRAAGTVPTSAPPSLTGTRTGRYPAARAMVGLAIPAGVLRGRARDARRCTGTGHERRWHARHEGAVPAPAQRPTMAAEVHRRHQDTPRASRKAGWLVASAGRQGVLVGAKAAGGRQGVLVGARAAGGPDADAAPRPVWPGAVTPHVTPAAIRYRKLRARIIVCS